MGYEWIEDYCLKKPGVEKDFKAEWDAHRYMVAKKMFAMEGADRAGNAVITIKLEPSHGDFLRQQFEGKIIPGYYMNKLHWNSLYLDSDVPDEIVKDMLDEAYELIVAGLPKKTRDAMGL